MSVQRDNLHDTSPDTTNTGNSNGDKNTVAIVKPLYLYDYENSTLLYSGETASKLSDLGFPYLLYRYSFDIRRFGEVEEASIDLKEFVGNEKNSLSEESLVFLVAFLTQFINKKEEDYADIIFSKESAELYNEKTMCIWELLNTANICLLEGVAADALVIFLTSSIREATTASMRNPSASKEYDSSTELTIDSVIEILWGGNRQFADRGMMLMKFVHFYYRQDDEVKRFRRKKITMPELLDGIYYKEEADGTGLRKMNINERREEGKDGPKIIKYFEKNEGGVKVCIWGQFPREVEVVDDTFNIPKKFNIYLDDHRFDVDTNALRKILETVSQRRYKISEVRILTMGCRNIHYSECFDPQRHKYSCFNVLRWLRLQKSLAVLKITEIDVNVHMLEMINYILIKNNGTLSKLILGDLCGAEIGSHFSVTPSHIKADRFCNCTQSIKDRAIYGTNTCVHIAVSKIIDTISTLENLEYLDIEWRSIRYLMISLNRLFLWLKKSKFRTLIIKRISHFDDTDAPTTLIKHIMEIPGIIGMCLEYVAYNLMYQLIDTLDIKLLMTKFRKLIIGGWKIKASERQNEANGQTLVTEYFEIEVYTMKPYNMGMNYFNRLKDILAEARELKTLNIITKTTGDETYNFYSIEFARSARSTKELQIDFELIHSHQHYDKSPKNLEGIEVLLVRKMNVNVDNLPILNGFISYLPNLKIIKVCHKYDWYIESPSKTLREIGIQRFVFKSYSEENKESTFVVES